MPVLAGAAVGIPLGRSGQVSRRASGRYHRGQVRTIGEKSKRVQLHGLDVTVSQGGRF